MVAPGVPFLVGVSGTWAGAVINTLLKSAKRPTASGSRALSLCWVKNKTSNYCTPVVLNSLTIILAMSKISKFTPVSMAAFLIINAPSEPRQMVCCLALSYQLRFVSNIIFLNEIWFLFISTIFPICSTLFSDVNDCTNRWCNTVSTLSPSGAGRFNSTSGLVVLVREVGVSQSARGAPYPWFLVCSNRSSRSAPSLPTPRRRRLPRRPQATGPFVFLLTCLGGLAAGGLSPFKC